MTALTIDQIIPGRHDIDVALEALPHVEAYLARRHERDTVRVVVDEHEESVIVPRGVVDLMARVLALVAAGESVSIVPSRAELTTQQAADLLNVSRPFLIGLLETGQIEYRTVGKHRRVKAGSLHDYLRQDDQRRREAADELAGLNQKMGLT
ncbi:helix-turn-helix domain-containing protein [Amycolatopsis umgeniensis]|uniref:Excisionase family DNA binding protein n=1 Tax=Amycolatopsis umgeniensis TaxID=336628 RepID=A0A841B429_9PSEU|nr:helix-turn-helix domain-containing protein [Amycolatopsis umgeniensis]MBB5853691.1 excisionase family DNA binding protein [Amycolatopsis umgeniensis]